MRVLLFGSNGFVGRHVYSELEGAHEVLGPTSGQVDLQDRKSIDLVIKDFQPEAIISCAGIIANDDSAAKNVQFSGNIINSVIETGIQPKRIIICGSAAVYGVVDKLPVTEDAPLKGQSPYALAKIAEEQESLRLAAEAGLPLTIARIFNPVGKGMNKQQLLSRIIAQIDEIKQGARKAIEVNRLDSVRDYIDIRDVALAIRLLIERDPKSRVYNVGTGIDTSTKSLIDIVIKNSDLEDVPTVHEVSDSPEGMVASQSDVTRISTEFNWSPKYTVEDSIKEIVDDHNRGQ